MSQPLDDHQPGAAPRPISRLQNLSLRAFDLSERAARRGALEQRQRVNRWRGQLPLIAQAAIGSAFAWWLATVWLGHPQPVFAAVSAIIALGLSNGQTLTRVVEVCVGVAVGVLLGDLFVAMFGVGFWQIALVVVLAMSISTWLGARTLMVTQSGIQAATVMTLLPRFEQGGERVLDALLGCGIALLLAVLAPVSSIRRPRIIAGDVLREAAGSLRAARDALTSTDQSAADQVLVRARSSEVQLTALQAAANEGLSVVRHSPLLRGHREHAQEMVDLVAPLDRLTRNLRVLARRAAVAVWRDEVVPLSYVELMAGTAEVVDQCAAELHARRVPVRVRDRIIDLARESSHLPIAESLSATVVLAQLRSIQVDLLELTGLSYSDARELVPEMD